MSFRLYKSGDWGYMMSDGSFEICGRCDTMVKIRGYSVETQVRTVIERSCSASMSSAGFRLESQKSKTQKKRSFSLQFLPSCMNVAFAGD